MSEKSELYVELGEKAFARGNYRKALKAFKRAIENDPMDKVAWNNKGVVLEEFEKFELAVECYDRALEIDPKFDLALNNKGYALAKLGRYDEALKCFNMVLKLDPQNKIAIERKKEIELIMQNLKPLQKIL